ncbi:MAG: hypothetical protein Q4B52_07385 [Tissierellia bacterium]|nr:hypothetical protein [Tissierellia bacterium]
MKYNIRYIIFILISLVYFVGVYFALFRNESITPQMLKIHGNIILFLNIIFWGSFIYEKIKDRNRKKD